MRWFLLAASLARAVLMPPHRDQDIRVQLHYTEKERLARVHVDMAPLRSLPIPALATTIHWTR